MKITAINGRPVQSWAEFIDDIVRSQQRYMQQRAAAPRGRVRKTAGEVAYLAETAPNKLGCCGLFALATITGEGLPLVFTVGRRVLGKRANWSGGTRREDRHAIAKALGFTIRPTEYDVAGYRLWHIDSIVSPGTYLVTTTRHVQVVEVCSDRSILVTDQTYKGPIDGYWGKNKAIKWIERVTEGGAA